VLPCFAAFHIVASILLPYLLPRMFGGAASARGLMGRFTDKFIAALRPMDERFEKWEGGGFGIRVSPRGGKAWIWVYHFDGRSRRMTLGAYPATGLADARIKLADARKLLERGVDPGDREVQARAAETIAELTEAYLDKWARPRKRSAAEDERILRKDVIPAWGRRKAQDIARRDVIVLLDRIIDRGSPIAANRTLAVVRRMFGWALSRDIIPANPCAAVKAPGKETRRDRVLSAEEIAALWRSLDDPATAISQPIRLALKLQLATAQRKGEVIDAEWSEYDITEGIWTIPGERAKNGMPHRVPLSSVALAVLDEIRAMAPEGRQLKWLFPSPRRRGPITGPAVDHAMRHNREALGTGDATPHDLRRTAASHMTSIGISRLVVSKILNHAEPGITAVYDRHSYNHEKRAALDAWGARLEAIIAGRVESSNVLRMRA
jgi:integrase